MSNYFLRSTTGNDATNNGTTWALAEATLSAANGDMAAGDTLFLSDNHSESSGSVTNLTSPGTLAAPCKYLCVDDTGDPSSPSVLAITATISVTTTGGPALSMAGSFYMYGVILQAGSGAGNSGLGCSASAGHKQVYEQCKFRLTTTSTAPVISIQADGNVMNARVDWIDCWAKFGNGAQGVNVRGVFRWSGGGLESGTAGSMTALIKGNGVSALGHAADILLDALDLSNMSTGAAIFTTLPPGSKAIIRRCKLPASWTGVLLTGTITQGARAELYNCDNGATNYRLWIEDYYGSIKHETTIIRTGGASDGTTGISWKMTSSADAEYPHGLLYSPEIEVPNTAIGSSKTLTVEIVHDSQGAGSGGKFQDDEIWVEALYLSSSGSPIGTWVRDCKADVLATAVNQSDSTETWTTTGLTSPVKQKLSVPFTPQMEGTVICRIVLAKGGTKTAYVCPKAQIT